MSSAQNEFRREKQGRAWGEEMSPKQKFEYGEGMRALRAAEGLTDGLRCSQAEFHSYLERKEAENKRLRGW